MTAERDADTTLWRRWDAVLTPLVVGVYPASPASRVEPDAPDGPVGADVWQLADDADVYGDQAGQWIVVDASMEHELSDAFPTIEAAQAAADAINADDPVREEHRHCFTIRLPLGTNVGDPAMPNRSINRFVVSGPLLAVRAAARLRRAGREVRSDGVWIFDATGDYDTTTYQIGDALARESEALTILCLHCPEGDNYAPAGFARWAHGARVQTITF